MLYLYSFAGRIGYVQNTLNTLHLPYGAENEYEYTLERSELKSEPYVEKAAMNAQPGEDVLISFINKDPDAPYPYIPLRKAKLLYVDQDQDRIYYTVVLLEHCTPPLDEMDDYQIRLRNAFSELLFTEEDGKRNGYLAFFDRDHDYDFKLLDEMSPRETPWLTAVKLLSEVAIFQKYNCVFTKLTIEKQADRIPVQKEIINCGEPTYDFRFNKAYCAELAYYVPFHIREKGTVIDVQFCSSPNEASLMGAMLTQKMNVNQGKLRFVFITTTMPDFGELIFKITAQSPDVTEPIYMAWKGVSYKVVRSVKRYAVLAGLALLCFGMTFLSMLLKSLGGDEPGTWYVFGMAALSLGIPIATWGTMILWNGNKK